MWKLKIDKEMKMSMEAFNKVYDNIWEFARGGNKAYQLRSGNVRVTNAYETNNYLFIRMLRFLTDNSGKANTYYLFYDKKLNTTKVVRAEDFVDDILGLGAYGLQIYDEKIFMTMWPHEIFDIIDKKMKAGEKIHPKLATLAKQIDEGDNPVIFVAHLKK